MDKPGVNENPTVSLPQSTLLSPLLIAAQRASSLKLKPTYKQMQNSSNMLSMEEFLESKNLQSPFEEKEQEKKLSSRMTNVLTTKLRSLRRQATMTPDDVNLPLPAMVMSMASSATCIPKFTDPLKEFKNL